MKTKKVSKKASKKLFLASVIMAGSAGIAAEEADFEEVVILGEKVARSLQDTVSSVSVLTASDIEQSSILTIQDAYNRMANVSGFFNNEGLQIRGINYNSVGLGGSGGLITVQIDGATLSSRALSLGQGDLWDISQVEVFRGAQSLNQGRNAIGGAVIIRSADPTYEQEAKGRVILGEYNTRITSGAFSAPIINDELAFRVSLDSQESDGSNYNPILGSENSNYIERKNARAKLLWEPESVDGLRLLATLSDSETDRGDRFVALNDEEGNSISAFERISLSNIPSNRKLSQSIATLEASYDLSDNWSITSTSSHNESTYDELRDNDRQPTGEESFRLRLTNSETLSQELRFNFNYDTLSGLIGAYYFSNDSTDDIDDFREDDFTQDIINAVDLLAPEFSAFGPAIANLYPVPISAVRLTETKDETENWAVFANAEFSPSDRVTLFAGFRYDQETVDISSVTSGSVNSELPDPTALPAGLEAAAPLIVGVNSTINEVFDAENVVDPGATYEAFLPAAGITFNINNDINTSFRVQKGYRAGGAGVLFTGVTYEYEPEFTTNYELSFRSQWFDNRLSLNANAFYIDWIDQQIQIVGVSDFITVNAGESVLSGAEIELNAQFNEVLSFFANIGFTKTEFVEFSITEEQLADFELTQEQSEAFLGDFEGNEFIGAPKITYAAGFNYSPVDRFSIQSDISFTDASFDTVQNLSVNENDDRTLVNLKLSYELNDHFDFSLLARNLFDEEYITQTDIVGDNVVNIGDPRVVALQINTRF